MKHNIYLAGAAVLLLSGCAMKTKILDTTAISMTRTNLKAGEKLQETGPVTGNFCMDSFNQKGSIGLLDESVKSAQTQYNVDYILNASFWQEGSCISVEGTGAKVVTGSVAGQPAASPGKRKGTTR